MTAFLIVLCLLFAWALTAERMALWSVSAPLAFAVAGAVLAGGDDPAVPVHMDAHGFQRGVELVLAVLLFIDATESKDYDRLERTVGAWRLLGLALPLSIAAATLAGALLFPGTNWWLLGVTALVVMPIDLAPLTKFLGDRRVPLRVRAALNVEGGLNDGLISPLFVYAVAHLVAGGNTAWTSLLWRVFKESGLALIIGTAVGLSGAWLVRRALAAGWAGRAGLPMAALALPFLTYAATVLAGGNGFVAAFVAGLGYAPTAHRLGPAHLSLVHDAACLMGFAVWFLFGGLSVDQFSAGVGWPVVLYALLALTVARFLPVMLALTSTALTLPERAAVGWFGSRGVTSIVFAVLAAAQLPQADSDFVVTAMSATVLLSLLLHAVTLRPAALWFERHTPSRTGHEHAALRTPQGPGTSL